MLNLLASLAEFKLGLIRGWVKAGMDRVRRQGRIGRPRVINRQGLRASFGALDRLADGSLSRRQAAKEPKIGYARLPRLLLAQTSDGSA